MSDSLSLQNRRYGSSQEEKKQAGKKKNENTEPLLKSARLEKET